MLDLLETKFNVEKPMFIALQGEVGKRSLKDQLKLLVHNKTMA